MKSEPSTHFYYADGTDGLTFTCRKLIIDEMEDMETDDESSIVEGSPFL